MFCYGHTLFFIDSHWKVLEGKVVCKNRNKLKGKISKHHRFRLFGQAIYQWLVKN